ncbi:Mitochondrial acidic protein mam33 [Malassezia cuniculi]|uniref:Mitochondrial acidic protein mam33 n=1 Tax=Malassezia cuniculi TaxID=948313 RepID=A0AAF0J4V5_9BASI|nr:Mitochondrial acidic protein mam33 [Malassezia cuniculi]
MSIRLALQRIALPRVASRAVRVAPVAAAARIATPVRAFTASARRFDAGESDAELASSLQQEIEYEREAAAETGGAVPDWLSQFKSEGVWQIEDRPGSDEVALTRQFGNEHIRVLFSIGEIDTTDPTNELEADETEDVASDGEFHGSFPVRCAISIAKNGAGSLNIDAQAADGQFVVENVTFYQDDKLATALTAEADWARRGLYIGPQFETLDENVQTHFESYLAERGFATNLALFIPSYAEYKEQREYCAWLEKVRAFISA